MEVRCHTSTCAVVGAGDSGSFTGSGWAMRGVYGRPAVPRGGRSSVASVRTLRRDGLGRRSARHPAMLCGTMHVPEPVLELPATSVAVALTT